MMYFINGVNLHKGDDCQWGWMWCKELKSYMVLVSSKFKYLDDKNYIGSALGYDACCIQMGCKLDHLGPFG